MTGLHVLSCLTCGAVVEVQKLQTHLSLLREEYVKLQRRLVEAEKSYQVAVAGTADGTDSSGFVTRLLKTVSDLYAKELYRLLSMLFVWATVNCYFVNSSVPNSPESEVLTVNSSLVNSTLTLNFNLKSK